MQVEEDRRKHDKETEQQRTDFADAIAELDRKGNERLAKLTNQVTLRIGIAGIIVAIIIGAIQIGIATRLTQAPPISTPTVTASVHP